jgi:anhydro-N-acetylmuramic acid kinase
MLAIGLMSGTSLDGIDAALIETDGENYFKQISTHHLPYSIEFQKKLRNLLDDWNSWLTVEKELTLIHEECINQLLSKTNVKNVAIIGFHGQTVFHNAADMLTWQFGNPHLLAQSTGIDVVSDYRRRDVARGGEGAPLVPIFHKCLCSNHEKPVAILNIGGVANITYIDENTLLAFDTGPGNALINDLMLKFFQQNYDESGRVASQGDVHQDIIDFLLQNEFFKRKPPKSLDRNEFFEILKKLTHLKPQDMVSTVTKLTVDSIKLAINVLPKRPKRVYVCGGGYKNSTIMNWLNRDNKTEFLSIKQLDYDPDFIEAQAFGYLAVRFLKKLPSSFPTTTGVSRETVCGVIFEA